MNLQVVLATVEEQVGMAIEYGSAYGWDFSAIDEEHLRFTVLFQSPIDQEKYLLEVVFDDYPQKPLLLDFLHHETSERGFRKCWPKGNDSFFNEGTLAICHPANRRAYAGYKAMHPDWKMDGWQKLAGGMIDLKSILDGIYSRLCDKTTYHGRFK
jgi:hypothetical protein